jgi:TolB-like protein
MHVAESEETPAKSKSGRLRQFVLLVLALGLLAVAGYRFGHAYQDTRPKRPERRSPSVGRPAVQQVRVPSAKHVLDVRPSPTPSLPEWPGSFVRSRLTIQVALPQGMAKAMLEVSAGDPAVPVMSTPVRAHALYQENPVYMEMRHFAIKAPDGRAWSLSVPCPPLPQNVRAIGEEEAITLVWDRLDTSVAPWASGPEVVILRVEVEAMLAAERQKDGRQSCPRFAEIARIPTTACSYRDESVQSGRSYIYRLAVEGEVTAELGDSASGTRERVTRRVRGVSPVENRMRGVVATAESPKPLRLALVASSGYRSRERVLAALRMLRGQLPSLPWVMLTERDMPQEVAEEKVVASMGQDEHGVAATELAPAEAGLLVEVPDFLDDELQVWLEDYLCGQRRLVARAPLSRPQDLFAPVAKALAGSFPERVPTRVADENAATARPRVAVLAFRPTSPASAVQVSRAAFREMLVGELASSSRFEIVDREWTDALFAEQERLALQGEEGASELGHVLGADYLLTGTYRLRRDKLVLEASLVEVAHGTRSNLLVCHGTLAEFGKLVEQLEDGLRVPRPFAEIGSAMPLGFAFRIDDSLRGADYRRRVDMATLARSRNPEDVLLAVAKMRKEDPDGARRLLEQLVARRPATKPEHLAKALPLLDALLCELGRTKRRAELWRELATDLPDGDLRRQVGADLRLAQALVGVGQMDEARELARSKPLDTRDVPLLASLGMYREALNVSLAEKWLSDETLLPGYARAVLLLRTCPPQSTVRRDLLAALAQRLSRGFPELTRQALLKLEEEGGVPDALVETALASAVQFHDTQQLERLLGLLPRLSPKEQVEALGRCLAAAGRHGDRAAAERLLALLRDLKPTGERARQMQEIRLRRGLPTFAEPTPPRTRAPSDTLIPVLYRNKTCGQQLGDTVYLVTKDEVLVAFDGKQRRILWEVDLEPRTPARHVAGESLSNSIWAEAGTIYVPVCQDGRLLAVDAVSGKVKWTFTAWGWISPPVLVGGGKQVIVGELGCGFLVLNAADGKLLKAIEPPDSVARPTLATRSDLAGLVQMDETCTRAPSPWIVLNPGAPNSYSRRGPNGRSPHGPSIVWWQACSLNPTTWETLQGHPPPAETADVLLHKLADPSVPMEERNRRFYRIPSNIPRDVLVPVLVGIVENGTEHPRLRQTALRTLMRRDANAAVETLVDLFHEPTDQDAAVAARACHLSDHDVAGLDDESVQQLVRLFREPSAAPARDMLAITLVRILGAGARDHIAPLLTELQARSHYRNWADMMGCAMAKHDMVESLGLLVPRAKPRGWRDSDPCYQAILALARSGCREARQYVSIPFDPEKHLALLRAAKSPLARAERNTLDKPYTWIRTAYPSPEFAGFLAESLRLCPDELRAAITETRVRVVGEEALLDYIHENTRKGTWGQLRKLACPVTGLDLGSDGMAWEQVVRHRRRR